jgi:hypothetical protein
MLNKAGMFCRRVPTVYQDTQAYYYLRGGGGDAVPVAGTTIFPSQVPLTLTVGGLGESSVLDEYVSLGTAADFTPPDRAAVLVWGQRSQLVDVRGWYFPAGSFNGRPVFFSDPFNGATIQWYGAFWILNTQFGQTYWMGNGEFPGGMPQNLAGQGFDPAPQVDYYPSLADFYGGTPSSAGVVYLFYDETVPALTISDGLEYVEQVGAGKRLVVFLSGSGTITFP